MADDSKLSGLDSAAPPTSAAEADQLIAQALANPDLPPATRAVLAPVRWYLNRLQRQYDALTAPLRAVHRLVEKFQGQQQLDDAWRALERAMALRPFAHESGAEVFRSRHATWRPPATQTWAQMAQPTDAPLPANRLTVFINPEMRGVAVCREDGGVFVERYARQAHFVARIKALSAGPARERAPEMER